LSKLDLQAIPRSRVFTQVAKRLQDHILHELKPGDMLPSERELVRGFHVSRGSVRDAIRSLEAVGLLTPLQGVGTVVCDAVCDRVAAPMVNIVPQKRKNIGELLEVRLSIEPALAARAALRATAEQIAEMESILARQEEKLDAGKPATEEDTSFHHGIALAADNAVILKVVGVLMELLRECRQHSLEVPERQRKSWIGHRRILAALKQRNAASAEAAMRRHLVEVERIVLQQL
jgi:GntR family transcriptional regulator, transcriptional repressor for pyruvate dehydrogenase complex